MSIPKTIIQAKKLGYSVQRVVRYIAFHKDYPAIELPYEAHHDVAFQWRRKPKNKKRRKDKS